MVGITLDAEQIRTAPPEVRRWLERQVASAFAGSAEPPPAAEEGAHLVALDLEASAAVYAIVRDMPPVVGVFFDLGNSEANVGGDGIAAYRLGDLVRDARLENVEQLSACLQAIDAAVRRVYGDQRATFYALDRRGYCLIATETHDAIAQLWRRLLAGPEPADGSRHDGIVTPEQFPSLSGSVAPEHAHFDRGLPPTGGDPSVEVRKEPGL